ncbi:MAG: ubiquinol-cytochrome c reductase iron-sulfur subunit [Nitrospirae bacterium]|nr:ubiquinol-cytochrome c reductase iron-sulfur subunit [Nitrospirota bacterium]MBI3593797.1 ubiquinol-cytochrome c reductase iron-sulfur subunit [Nitrospirota bacterium]
MDEVTRRSFFGKMIALIAGAIAACLSYPILGYTLLHAFKKEEEAWAEMGPLDRIPVNQPKEFQINRTLSSGWMKTNSVQTVWAFRKPEGPVVVYSPLCTHLGCGYHWDDQEKNFICPCHNSVYDMEGKVLSGPAPRPLDTLPTQIKDDRLFILYKEFKTGLSGKQEI